MSALVHLFRAELFRLRWWAAAWPLLQLPGLLVLWTDVPFGGSLWPGFLGVLAFALQALWSGLLTLELWADLPPAEEPSFWRTRPLGAGVVLIARVLVFVCIQWILPVAVSSLVWLGWGLSAPAWINGLRWQLGFPAVVALCVLASGVLNPMLLKPRGRALALLLTVPCLLAAAYGWQSLAVFLLNRQGVYADGSGLVWWQVVVALGTLGAAWILVALARRRISLVVLLSAPVLALLHAWLFVPAEPSTQASERARGLVHSLERLEHVDTVLPREIKNVRGVLSAPIGDAVRLTGVWGFLEQSGVRLPVQLSLSAMPSQGRIADHGAGLDRGGLALQGHLHLKIYRKNEHGGAAAAPFPINFSAPLRLRVVAELDQVETERSPRIDLADLAREPKILAGPEGWVLRLETSPSGQGRGVMLLATQPFRSAHQNGPRTTVHRLAVTDREGRVHTADGHVSSSMQLNVLGVLWVKRELRHHLRTGGNPPGPGEFGVRFESDHAIPEGRVLLDLPVGAALKGGNP